MSIQYMVQGFKPTTFGNESRPITTSRPGLPPSLHQLTAKEFAKIC